MQGIYIAPAQSYTPRSNPAENFLRAYRLGQKMKEDRRKAEKEDAGVKLRENEMASEENKLPDEEVNHLRALNPDADAQIAAKRDLTNYQSLLERRYKAMGNSPEDAEAMAAMSTQELSKFEDYVKKASENDKIQYAKVQSDAMGQLMNMKTIPPEQQGPEYNKFRANIADAIINEPDPRKRENTKRLYDSLPTQFGDGSFVDNMMMTNAQKFEIMKQSSEYKKKKELEDQKQNNALSLERVKQNNRLALEKEKAGKAGSKENKRVAAIVKDVQSLVKQAASISSGTNIYDSEGADKNVALGKINTQLARKLTEMRRNFPEYYESVYGDNDPLKGLFKIGDRYNGQEITRTGTDENGNKVLKLANGKIITLK